MGTYSEANTPCVPCPANSEATQNGTAECRCDLGYYRAPEEGPSVACTREIFILLLHVLQKTNSIRN